MHGCRFLFVAALAGLIMGCGSDRSARGVDAALTALAAAIDRRLLLAGDIAWSKYQSGSAVRDPAQEEAVLYTIHQQAAARGLDPLPVREFFQAQLAASRQWQQECMDRWKNGEPLPPGTPPDLATVLRPRMDVATAELLDAWQGWAEATGRTRFTEEEIQRIMAHLQAAGYSSAAARLACGQPASPTP